MIRPATLREHPSPGLLLLGGLAATLLASALLFVMPALGFSAPRQVVGSPFLDLPRLIGGIFSGDAEAAFWLGFWLFFFGGALILPLALGQVWRLLPGADVGLTGAVVKGGLGGLILWIISGLLVPLLAVGNRLGVANPGLFAIGAGPLAVLGLCVWHLIYGVSLALVAALGHGIKPLNTLGWEGYRPGEHQQEAIY